MIAALGRGGYRRYDERTATQLREMAPLVLDRYGGDLRRLADAADGDVDRAARLLQEVKGIGPTGAAVFLREVQAVWPWVRPYLDDRARAGARRVGLPDDGERLAAPGRAATTWPGSPPASSASRACPSEPRLRSSEHDAAVVS